MRGVLLAVLFLGCDTDKPTAPNLLPAEETLGSLEINPPVAIIAVGGSQQFEVTGRTLTGAPVTAFDSVRYVLNNLADSLRVSITPTGLVTGLATSAAHVRIDIFAFRGRAIAGEVALLQVTPTVVSGVTMSVQPVPPDSAKLAVGTRKTIVPVVRNSSTGAAVSNPVIRYSVGATDQDRVSVYRPSMFLPTRDGLFPVQPQSTNFTGNNQITPITAEGSAWIHAHAMIYGIPHRDSVLYTFSNRYDAALNATKANLAIALTFFGFENTVTPLAPGATVTFGNSLSASDPLKFSFTFDSPAAATAASPASTAGGATGNVTELSGGQSSRRRFLTPGTYKWTAVASGPEPWGGQTMSGTFVIK